MTTFPKDAGGGEGMDEDVEQEERQTIDMTVMISLKKFLDENSIRFIIDER